MMSVKFNNAYAQFRLHHEFCACGQIVKLHFIALILLHMYLLWGGWYY